MQWYPAPAKLNLFLHVLGRRPDGYHDLQTVFQLIDLHDDVGVAGRSDGQLLVVHRVAGIEAKDDLCLRAAVLLRNHAIEHLGRAPSDLAATLDLRKRLPIGGGLGGGSSDAATVLRVLDSLWGLDLGCAQLSVIGLRLGADVPFFLHGENAIGEGVGESLKSITLPPLWYLLVVPQVAVSTREIFADGALTRDSRALKIPPFLPGAGRNDLEPVACRRFPAVAEALTALRRCDPSAQVKARMSGSGSTVFSGFTAERAAREAAESLPQNLGASVQVRVACGLDRHPLLPLQAHRVSNPATR
jgi:4-diphosphocytidyl-2-C-methyl-D-erythritol kinase